MKFIAEFRVEHTKGPSVQLKSVQALRGIAAVLVMLSHLHGVEARYSETDPLLSSAWLFGVSGVDLFFVISGFIMVWIAGDLPARPASATEFFFARIFRIYPVWWLFAGAMALYFFFAYGTPWDAEMIEQLVLSGPEHLIKSMLLIPHDAFPVLQLGWTLVHEIYFYFVFGLILLLPAEFRSQAFIVWALLIIAAISAQLNGGYANTLLSLALFPMTLEFLMGVAIGLLIKRGVSSLSWPALLIGITWLSVAAATVDFSTTSETLPTLRTFAFGPAFALIVYGVVTLEQKEQFRDRIPTPLVALGDWSYSLYLCHLLVISALARLYFPSFGGAGPIDNLVFLIGSSAAAILVSGLAYTVFERPILGLTRRMRKRLFRANK